jgi:hypothetical protein
MHHIIIDNIIAVITVLVVIGAVVCFIFDQIRHSREKRRLSQQIHKDHHGEK